MLHISREKFQLMPEGKVLKSRDYCAYLEAENAIQHAYRENDHLIQYASQLCDHLVQDTNGQIARVVDEANERARDLIDQANLDAENIIHVANEKSQAIIDEALAKRAQIFEEAKKYYEDESKRGYEDGYAKGKGDMSRQLVEIAAKNTNNIKQLEGNITTLVVKALQRIIGEVDHKTLIVNLVRQALKSVKNQQEAILKVSPVDSQVVRDNLEEILLDGAVDYLEITPDSRLKEGTCILETDIGVIDASLEIQIQAIIEAFKKAEKELEQKSETASDVAVPTKTVTSEDEKSLAKEIKPEDSEESFGETTEDVGEIL